MISASEPTRAGAVASTTVVTHNDPAAGTRVPGPTPATRRVLSARAVTGATRAFEDSLHPKTFRWLAALFEERVGIRLPPAKLCLVESRLRRRVRALGLASLREYAALLKAPERLAVEFPNLVNALTINKTDFFREPAHFSCLRDRALPDVMARTGAGHTRPLSIWSAACSTGAEPYTMAMVLSEYARTQGAFRSSVLGLDIDTDALAVARRAVYPAAMSDPIPEALRRRYLLKAREPQNATVRIAPEVRRMVTFQPINLLSPDWGPAGSADIIFCRNVLIYFERHNQEKALRGLCERLRPGGYLFVSHSEALHGMALPLRSVAAAVYQRLGAAPTGEA
ncbi:protein-glutamate O-methyltransferase CheR [Roseospira marina]|uniref:protein-glutamate O-methyltransferase n=1 Tax=Roseospira marina TaxID=140057 RepID=A0A5M6IA24_9PROT|nr:protein-glutamate O-methyltransferase CheR [Roseospira marina]KAA5604585.1 protein-glutamate O-methyltransferase CheR [Roseospira marina]MBB4315335.1 chemotaxis protein methyltransferase CheR [Roseospira marina]MBB5088334.1 chemotaxis protein methyltransferase CheR [Roseospira marina]